MKILNLYAGIGGNRKLWGDEHEITAVEINPDIAKIYGDFFPNDKLVVGDAHQYLLDHFQGFNFIWSSPPCQSHSRFIRSGNNRKPRYPNMALYEEILLLKHNCGGFWVVENVKPYYGALIDATTIGRHLFWSNFVIPYIKIEQPKDFITLSTVAGSEKLKNWLGLNYKGNIYYNNNHCPAQILRNCVHPKLGLHVLNSAISMEQQKLFSQSAVSGD